MGGTRVAEEQLQETEEQRQKACLVAVLCDVEDCYERF
jgi:hypothetical protein